MDKRKEFSDIYKKHIKREGADKLLKYLEDSDFFTAPASTKFHNNFEGGLCEHSVNVFHRFKSLCEAEKLKVSDETVAICALLHDICKVSYYSVEMRNTKSEQGEWIKKPYYAIKDSLPFGHGEKSVYIISGFMRLTREEAMAINWHMGGFDDRVQGGSYSSASAYYQFPLALLFHLADMQATYLDEKIVE